MPFRFSQIPMLLVFTHQITNRVKYVFDLLFKNILGVDYELTTDVSAFGQFHGAKISYSHQPIENEIFFRCSNLLFETGVKKEWLNISVSEKQDIFSFDVFASSFFLVSRYEEYFSFAGDKYGRFPAKQSFSYKNGFLHKPVVNIWAKKIKKAILEKYPLFIFPKKKYSFVPTIDVDNAYAYRGKGALRTLGGFARAIIKFDGDDFSKRTKVLSGKEKDPYDTYGFLDSLHQKYNLKPIFFFLLGDWNSMDKNLSHKSSKMKVLIKKISEHFEIGIHPSFQSHLFSDMIKTEISRLENISGKKIHKSRQHFLLLKFPETYRKIFYSGITDDYTMGYADALGFRAGICSPFQFYDLEKEQELPMIIHPFAVMDGTLNNYLKLSPEQGIEAVKNIVSEIKSVDGEFISIWHNETLSNWCEWKGWENLYEKIIQLAL